MINLHDEIIKEIANILVMDDPESRLLYLQSINNESGEGTQNSRHQHKWDYRYNSLIEMAKKHGLQHIKLKRGNLWEAVLIVGPENEVYAFFSHKNMQQIINQGKTNHYMILLNLFNEGFDELPPLNSQMELPIFDDKENSENLKEKARLMLDMMEKDPSKVFVFAFDYSFISTVKVLAFNTKQEIVWERDLTDLIQPNYKWALYDDEINPVRNMSKNTLEIKNEKKQIVRLKNTNASMER